MFTESEPECIMLYYNVTDEQPRGNRKSQQLWMNSDDMEEESLSFFPFFFFKPPSLFSSPSRGIPNFIIRSAARYYEIKAMGGKKE